MTHDLMTRKEAGDYLKISFKTLAKWAWADTGPAYFKVGGRAMYEKNDIDTWLNERKQETKDSAVGYG